MGCSSDKRNHAQLNSPYQAVPTMYSSGACQIGTTPAMLNVKIVATSAPGSKRACSELISPVTPSISASDNIISGSGTCQFTSINCSIRLLKANREPPIIRRLKKRLCGVSRPEILQQAGTSENSRTICNWPNIQASATGIDSTSV